MLRIERNPQPEFWDGLKKFKNYNELDNTDEGKKMRSLIREYLIKEQKGICAYCCRSIDNKSSLNEHIKPRDSFDNHSLDYDNIVASCTQSDTCSAAKGKEYSQKFVSPLDDDVENHFALAPNGTIICLTEKAEYTCELLNLNSHNLTQVRKAVIDVCKMYGEDIEDIIKYYLYKDNGDYQAYADAIKYYCDHSEIR